MSTNEGASFAPPAISDSTEPTQTRDRRGAKPTKKGSSPISDRILENAGSGFGTGDDTLPPALLESPTSMPFEMPRSASSKHWPTPTNVRELAGQANQVATLVLNGEMDIERARIYGALVRGIAQMMSIEVTRARFLRTEPILTLTTPEDE